MLSFRDQVQAATRKLDEASSRVRETSRSRQELPAIRFEALAFNLERVAWAMIEIAQAWVFEERLGIPRKETDYFDLLQRHGWIELDRARRFKQLCEFRSLSQREPSRLDRAYLSGELNEELALVDEWTELARGWLARRENA